MRIDLARLNHILIPKSSAERERLRRSRGGRVAVAVTGATWGALTDEGRTFALVTCIAGTASVDVLATTAYAVFVVAAGLLIGSLFAARALSLRDIELRIEAPRRVTIGEEVSFSVVLARRDVPEAHRSPPQPVRVRGPFLPWDGTWTAPSPHDVVVPAHRDGSREARATLRARFVARGLHHLDPFTAAAVAPLGLARGPRRASETVKLYVVPRVARVARLPLGLRARHQPGGVALASKSGEAMDLSGVRPYRPGDPVRDLHARSWARTGVPVVREYQQEYFTRVGVVLDTDTRDEDLLDAAIELAAGVIAHLSRGEALVDVLVVGARVHELTVGRSLGHLDQALELLATVERGAALDAQDLTRRLEPYFARLSSVIFVAVEGGDERAAFHRDVERRGVSCATLTLDAATRAALRAGEELAF